MRKILYILPPIALLLCLALVLMMTGILPTPSFLSGFGKNPDTAETTAAPTLGTTEAADDWTRQNMISISLPEMTETVLSADGITLFRHTFQDVVISSPNPQINESLTLDLLKRMDVNASAVAQLADMAQYYTPGTPWNTLCYELLYTPTRIDSTVMSLKGTELISTGSGQDSYTTVCANYYIPTGSVMTLSQILSEETNVQDKLLQALLKVLSQKATDWSLFEDYSESVTQYFPSYLQQESIWFFSQQGLNICFAPYEIAPYSSGTIIATIPYANLVDIVRSDILPEDPSKVKGAVGITDFASAPLDRYSYFSECILSTDAPANHLLSTDTILYDVRLEQGSYDTDTGVFTPYSTVFAANNLCSDQAIRLCWDPDSQQILLRCITGGESKRFLLTINSSGLITLQPVTAS